MRDIIKAQVQEGVHDAIARAEGHLIPSANQLYVKRAKKDTTTITLRMGGKWRTFLITVREV